MPGRAGERQRRLADGLDVEVPAVGRDHAQPELDLARLDQLGDGAGRRLEDAHLDAGMGLVEPAQDRRQVMHRERRQAGDVEAVAALGALLLQFVERLLELGDGLLRLGQEVDAGARERDLAGGAGEQLDPELLLELAHAVADRGLRQVEVRGGTLEAAALRDAQEGLQAEEIDAHFGLRVTHMNQIHQ
jgi:hypothetical protein